MRDITEEWRANSELEKAVERQALLSAEWQHRIKNTLFIVGAIANQTTRGDSVTVAREAFSARLMTLSDAHDSQNTAPVDDDTLRKFEEEAAVIIREAKGNGRCFLAFEWSELGNPGVPCSLRH